MVPYNHGGIKQIRVYIIITCTLPLSKIQWSIVVSRHSGYLLSMKFGGARPPQIGLFWVVLDWEIPSEVTC